MHGVKNISRSYRDQGISSVYLNSMNKLVKYLCTKDIIEIFSLTLINLIRKVQKDFIILNIDTATSFSVTSDTLVENMKWHQWLDRQQTSLMMHYHEQQCGPTQYLQGMVSVNSVKLMALGRLCIILTKEDKMKFCLSSVKEMNTDEVIPAKQVTDAALAFHKKWKRRHSYKLAMHLDSAML